MIKRVVAFAFCLSLIAATSASAQVHFLASVLGGYTWADGLTGNDYIAPNGNTYNGVSATNSGMFGASFGVAEGHGEYGFLYRRQFAQFKATGSVTTVVGDMPIDTYHGYFAYNFGDPDGKMNYYVSAGAGLTHFAPVTFTPAGGGSVTISGRSEFSTTFGAGIRFMATDHIGFRLGVQWTPTYIKTEPSNIWCSPEFGCLFGDQFTNQVDLMGGVVFRFGK
jgi:hypothetical protein